MPLDPTDIKLLWDMLDAARRMLRHVHGFDEARFHADEKTQDAVERRAEVIGETARNVSNAARQAIPGVAWTAIVGTRHILAHEYGEIDQSQMWRIATVHIPALIAQLEPILREYPPPPEAAKDLASP